MAYKVRFENGLTANFDSMPSQKDIEEVSQLHRNQPVSTLTHSPVAFRTGPDETPVSAGLKAIGNVPSSLYGQAKGVFDFLNPVNAFNNLSGAVSEVGGLMDESSGLFDFLQKFGQSVGTGAKEVGKELIPPALRQGSLEEAGRSFAEDPMQLTQFFLALDGLARGAGYGKQFEAGIKKVAEPITKPIESAASATGRATGATTKFLTSQATGLAPETLKTVVESPSEFARSKMEATTRASLADDVFSGINKAFSGLKETGKAYEPFRASKTSLSVPKSVFTDVLTSKYGVKFRDGKIILSPNMRPMSISDLNQLQNFLDTYNIGKHTANTFLNTREALADLAKYEQGKTETLQVIARDLRSALNERGRPQVKGLERLDRQYEVEKTALKKIKKDYFNADGTLKDGAVNKLANLAGKGKEQTLGRLEKITPGVTKRIQILRAVEDIQAAYGQKVGTYVRGGVLAGGVATLNLPVIIAAIISNPSIAVPLLRLFGVTKAQIPQIIQSVKAFVGDVNNLKVKGKAGLSIEDVSGKKPIKTPKGLEPLSQEARKYVYHGTNENVLGSISKEGLKPMRRGELSLSKDEAYASSFAREGMTPQGKTKAVMLRVNTDLVKGKTPSKSGVASDRLNEILTKETIPPEALEIYKNGKWEPLKPANDLLSEARKYKSAEEFVKGGEITQNSKIVWQTNLEGGQKIGNTQILRKPTLEDFTKEILPRTRKGYYGSGTVEQQYKNMLAKEPDITISFIDRGNGWEVSKIDSLAVQKREIEAGIQQGWARVVDNFESPVAKYFRETADSKIKTKSQLTDIWKEANKK